MHSTLDAHKHASENLDLLEKYVTAMNAQDVRSLAALLAPDVIFENTYPAPDGERLVGREAYVTFTEQLLQSNRDTRFSTEELTVGDDVATVRWRYDWVDQNGTSGHVRGATIMRFANGLISESYNYVKG